MSLELTTRIWDDGRLDAFEVLVMLAVSEQAVREQAGYVARLEVPALVVRTRLSGPTVRFVLDKLTDGGLLSRSPNEPDLYVLAGWSA